MCATIVERAESEAKVYLINGTVDKKRNVYGGEPRLVSVARMVLLDFA